MSAWTTVRSATHSHCICTLLPSKENGTSNAGIRGLVVSGYLPWTCDSPVPVGTSTIQTVVNALLFFPLGDLLLSERASPCSDPGNSDEEDKDDVQSQGSSASSEDYIIILPECFDTSRPLGESMYSSALSQPSLEKTGEPETRAEIPEGGNQQQIHSISDTPITSQAPAVVPLAPETADTLPQMQR